MPVSEAQRRAHEKYFKENYRQVKLSMPNEEAEALEKHCASNGYTKAGFIRQAIREKMERGHTANLGDNATEEAEHG